MPRSMQAVVYAREKEKESERERDRQTEQGHLKGSQGQRQVSPEDYFPSQLAWLKRCEDASKMASDHQVLCSSICLEVMHEWTQAFCIFSQIKISVFCVFSPDKMILHYTEGFSVRRPGHWSVHCSVTSFFCLLGATVSICFCLSLCLSVCLSHTQGIRWGVDEVRVTRL